MKNSHIKTTVILISILLLGAFLRFYGLENQSFWNDELFSWEVGSMTSIEKVIQTEIDVDVHPPLFLMTLFYVNKIIGGSEAAVRMLSVLMGILAIFFMYKLAKLLFTVRIALLSAGMLAIMHTPIFFSQEARSYSMMLCLSLISVYIYVLQIKSVIQNNKINYIALILLTIINIILAYTHYFGLYLVLMEEVCIVLFWKRKLFFLQTITFLAVALSYIPWLPGMAYHLTIEEIHIKEPTLLFPLRYFYFSFGPYWLVLGVFIIIFLFLFYNYFKNKVHLKEYCNNGFSSDIFILVWLFFPILPVFIKSLVSTPVLNERNLIICLPAIYMIAVRAFESIPLSMKNRNILAVAVLCVTLFFMVFIYRFYDEPHKEQFREISHDIIKKDSIYKPNTIITFSWSETYFNYYIQKTSSPLRVQYNIGEDPTTKHLDSLLRLKEHKYLIFAIGHRKNTSELLNHLFARYKAIDSTILNGTSLYVFEH